MIAGKGWGATETDIQSILSKKGYPKNSVHRKSGISFDEMLDYYKEASFLISTSFYEGLGLPIIEAMALGCPVLVPKNSAFIEVVQHAGVLVEGWDEKNWLRSVDILLENSSLYIKRGLLRANKYKWEFTIDNFVNILEKLDKLAK